MANHAGLSPELALAVVGSMGDAVLVVDPGGVIEAAGGDCVGIFGWEPAELLGRNVDMLVPSAARTAHRGHRARYRDDPTSRPMGVGLRLDAERRDGTLCAIDVALTPFDSDGRVLAVVRDESEQAAVRAEKELVHRLLDAMSEGVFMFDPRTLKLSYVNDGAVRQTGYSRAELTGGMSPVDVAVGSDEVSFREVLRPLLDGGVEAIEFEAVLVRRDGRVVPVDVLLQRPVLDGPEGADAVPVVALSRDMSERRAAEAERDRQRRWLESLSDTRLAALTGIPADDVLTLVCDHVRHLTEASVALVVEPAPDAHAMTVELASPAELAPIHLRLPLDGRLSRGLDLDPGSALSLRLEELDGSEAELASRLGVGELLAAPFRVEANADGLLVVGRGPGALPWSASDAELLSSYALEAATALELARSRVENQRLAMLEDRERIAADLHDMVIQRLFAAGMRLQGMLPLVTGTPLADRMRELVDDLDATIGEIRQAIFDLQHAEAEIPSLEELLRDTVVANETYLGFRPTLTVQGDLDAVPASVAEQLVPVVIEALSNVARHAGASALEVVVAGSAGGVELEVTDNGVGPSAPGRRGQGLGNMSRRARRLGGTFSIGPGPGGAGTTVRWSVGSHDGSDP